MLAVRVEKDYKNFRMRPARSTGNLQHVEARGKNARKINGLDQMR